MKESILFAKLLQGFQNINENYKKTFKIVFLINFFTFLLFITQNFLHNHGFRLPWLNPLEQVAFGRWFTVIVFYLTNSSDLPVFIPLVSISLNIISAILFTRVLSSHETSCSKLVPISLIISLYPAMLALFYFNWLTITYTVAILLAVLSILLTTKFSLLRILSGAMLVMFSLASYQPSLSLITTIFLSYSIIKIFHYEDENASVWVFFKENILSKILAIILGVISYKLSLPLLGIKVTAVTSTLSSDEIPGRILTVIKASFKSLYLTQPEFDQSVKLILLLVLVLSAFSLIICSYSKRQFYIRSSIITVLFLLLVISTKSMYLVSSNENFYIYRYNISSAFLHAFSFYVIFSLWKKKGLIDVALILSVFVIFKFSYADLTRQLVLLRAQEHDLSLANRLLYRIESLPGIDYSKKYVLLRIGAYSNYRNELLQARGRTFKTVGGAHMDRGDISDIWTPADVMKLLGSKVQFQYYGYTPNFQELSQEIISNVIGKRKAWPDQESVFVHEDKIIIIMTNPNLKTP